MSKQVRTILHSSGIPPTSGIRVVSCRLLSRLGIEASTDCAGGIADARELAVAYKFTISDFLLRLQVIAQNLIEALETHACCVLLLVVANLHSTPNAYDME